MFKVYDEPESPNEGGVYQIYHELEPANDRAV